MKYTIVDHNVFEFTIECNADQSYSGNYYLYDYFVDCSESDHQSYEIEIIKIKNNRPGQWEVNFKLTVRDYGVPQIGMHLLGAYLRNVYEPIYEGSTDFIIMECVFYHPSGRGARIDWDEINSKPLIERVDRENTAEG